MTGCQVESCDRAAIKRGMCNRHYEELRKAGGLEVDRRDALSRFWGRVKKSEDSCWNWTAAKSTGGYGRAYWGGRVLQAHRVAYTLLIGPIPEGLELDHLCRNRACVNPAHLEPVTGRINKLRGVGVSARNATRTHCPQGYEYTPENTRLDGRNRHCRACARDLGVETALRQKWDRQSTVWTRTCLHCVREFQSVGEGRKRVCSEECRRDRQRMHAREYQRRKRAAN